MVVEFHCKWFFTRSSQNGSTNICSIISVLDSRDFQGVIRMHNIPESENIEIGTCYPSYSDIESGSSVHKVMSIVHENPPKIKHLRVELYRWPVKFGICQIDISC